MWESPVLVIGVAVIALLLVAFVVLALRVRAEQAAEAHRRPRRDDFRPEQARHARPPRHAAFVINPTKFTDVTDLERRLTASCLAHDWAEPAFLHTTAEDPGTGQARRAAAEGADVVCALGGDGTVRAVAEALAGTRTPLGLLPSGTGNLLARTMGLPLADLEAGLDVALGGQNLRVDVGRLRAERPAEGAATDHVFVVMAGLGFDAAIMATTDDELKAKVGWPAYLVSGARNLRGDRFHVTVSAGPEETVVFDGRTRMAVVGNCGRLLGGIDLMPDARIDDGLLDTILISPRTMAGWVAVAARVLGRKGTSGTRVHRHTATRFVVRPSRPEPLQVDGDVIGPASAITTEVWPGALTVRVPVGYQAPVA